MVHNLLYDLSDLLLENLEENNQRLNLLEEAQKPTASSPTRPRCSSCSKMLKLLDVNVVSANDLGDLLFGDYDLADLHLESLSKTTEKYQKQETPV